MTQNIPAIRCGACGTIVALNQPTTPDMKCVVCRVCAWWDMTERKFDEAWAQGRNPGRP